MKKIYLISVGEYTQRASVASMSISDAYELSMSINGVSEIEDAKKYIYAIPFVQGYGEGDDYEPDPSELKF